MNLKVEYASFLWKKIIFLDLIVFKKKKKKLYCLKIYIVKKVKKFDKNCRHSGCFLKKGKKIDLNSLGMG